VRSTTLAPESGLVALGRTPLSPWSKASPRRRCALAHLVVTFRWRIALHSKLQKGAGQHRVTASASLHKRAQCILMQHSRPLDRCILDFISTAPSVSDGRLNATSFSLHKRKRPTLHKRLRPTRLCHPHQSLLSPERDRRHPNMAFILVAPRRVHLGRRTL
jgi:hypothetical protein